MIRRPPRSTRTATLSPYTTPFRSSGKTVGSIGVGNIGSELFRLLAPLDLVHIAYDPYAKTEATEKLRVRLTDKDTVLRESDFVCINTPLTPETRDRKSTRLNSSN